MNLPLTTSPLMKPLVKTSNHSPKKSDRDMHASRTYGNSPSKKEVSHSPCAFWIQDTTATLRPHKTKNRKILNHHHSIDRTKTYDYNVTRKQKDNNKKNTGNK